MGEFNNILDRYAGDADKFLGNLEDVKKGDKYSEALQELDKLQGDKDNLNKFYDLNSKLTNIDDTKRPTTKGVDEYTFNDAHPETVNFENPAMKKYYDYAQNFLEINKGDESKVPMSHQEFFDHYPDLKQELINQGMYNKTTKQVEMNPLEDKADRYHKAGFTPEEVDFYEKNMDNLKGGADKLNSKYQNLLMQFYPQLASKFGKQGDMYNTLLSQKVSSQMVQPPKQDKWTYKYEDGKLIGTDGTRTGVTVKDLGIGSKEQNKYLEKIGFRITPKEGTDGKTHYMYETPQSDGTWKENGLEANDDQYKAYQTQLKDKEETKDERYAYQRSVSNSYKTGRKTHKSGKDTPLSHGDADDYASIDKYAKELHSGKVKHSDERKIADKLFGGDINKLKEVAGKWNDMNPKESRKYFDGLEFTPKTGDKPDDGSQPTNQNNVHTFGKYVKDLYNGANNQNEKDALESVNGWFKDVTNAWGRNTLTPDEWRKEASQQKFSDLEWEIVRQIFKDKFGEEI